jgi:hypothetical protein
MTLSLMALLLLHAPLTAPATAEPPLALPQFPPPLVAEASAQLAKDHWRWLVMNAPLNADRAWWSECVRASERHANCWLALQAARSGSERWAWLSGGEWWMRDDDPLEFLRDLLGPDDFAAGWMPEPIPPSHVRGIDP